jgi:hypothetical protein
VVGGYRHLYADEPLLDPERLNARDLVPGVLMRKYTRRNVSTTLRGEAVWSRAAPTPLDSSTDRVIRPLFNLTATLHFPVTRVSYTPDVAEVLKNAWIQYLAMLVIVAFLVDRLLSFVLYHQVGHIRWGEGDREEGGGKRGQIGKWLQPRLLGQEQACHVCPSACCVYTVEDSLSQCMCGGGAGGGDAHAGGDGGLADRRQVPRTLTGFGTGLMPRHTDNCRLHDGGTGEAAREGRGCVWIGVVTVLCMYNGPGA